MTGSEWQVTLSWKLGLKPGFLIYTNISQHQYISLTGHHEITFAVFPMTPGSIDLAHIFIESTDQLKTLTESHLSSTQNDRVPVGFMAKREAGKRKRPA